MTGFDYDLFVIGAGSGGVRAGRIAAKHGAPNIRKGGSIVFTSGIAGQRPWPGWSVASSICSAMEGLTRALAVELAPIRVTEHGRVPRKERRVVRRDTEAFSDGITAVE